MTARDLTPSAAVGGEGADGPEVGQDAVGLILSSYLGLINSTPVLLSLLYDANMLPEQTTTVRGALSTAAVCEAYKAALQPSSAADAKPVDARAICEALGFDPTNHHNAATCPYCIPDETLRAEIKARHAQTQPSQQAGTERPERVAELLEANNRYQQEAGDARAEVTRVEVERDRVIDGAKTVCLEAWTDRHGRLHNHPSVIALDTILAALKTSGAIPPRRSVSRPYL